MIIESPQHLDELKENHIIEEAVQPAINHESVLGNAELMERSSIAVVKNSNFKNAVQTM